MRATRAGRELYRATESLRSDALVGDAPGVTERNEPTTPVPSGTVLLALPTLAMR